MLGFIRLQVELQYEIDYCYSIKRVYAVTVMVVTDDLRPQAFCVRLTEESKMSLNRRLIKLVVLLLSMLFAAVAVILISNTRLTLAQGNRPAFGYTLVVGNDADTPGLLCGTPANCTLRSAIQIANSNGTPDLIVFTTGTHVITLTNGFLPTLVETTTYISGVDTTYTPQIVKINANDIAQAFVVSGYDILLDHLRIYGAGPGSSNIYITGASRHVVISNDSIGIDDPYVGSCNLSPDSYGGIYINATGSLPGGDGRVYIYGDYIICHGNATSEGISLVGTNNVVIGADALGNAGSNEHNIINNNAGNGLVVKSGSHDNFIRNSDFGVNANLGVLITGGSYFNVVKESSIYYNGSTGVQIDGGAQFNRIGNQVGAPITTANTIGGNTGDGIYISGASTANNAVYGNKIGTNSAGTAADANGGNGVVLDNGTHDNDIGSTISETNIIAGNGLDGVLINNGSHDNRVANNSIGRGSTTIPNHVDGIGIVGSFTNTIGGINQANNIWTNSASGIYLTGGSQHNLIGANIIAFNVAYGVMFDGNNTFYNTISRTLIALNNRDGIGERNNAVANVWSEVSIYQNGGLGIDKNASSDFTNVIDPPYMFFDSINRNTGVVQGHADTTDFVFDITKIELYRVALDPSGFGEGISFVGSTYTDGSGSWTITDPSPAQSNGCYTAFVTEAFPLLFVPLHSSEFSANTCRTFLPLVLKNY